MQRLVLAIHNHQPVGNFDSVFQGAYDLCYRPFIALLAEFPEVKVALHYTGPLLEWIAENRPAFLGEVRGLVERGQVEILGGGFYEPMLAVLSDADARGQIGRMQEFCRTHFGVQPLGMWLAERVWDPDLPRVIEATGTRYTLLDDAHFFAAGLPKAQLAGHYVTEKAGKTLAIFPIDQALRYAFPWKSMAEFEAQLTALERLRGDDPRVVTYGDDGEKFGLWPKTHPWVYGPNGDGKSGWLREFLTFLRQRSDLVTTVHPGQALDALPASGRIYLPTASYEEMGEWSLPAAAVPAYEELRQRLRGQGVYERFQPFLRGGIWQGFFAKYPESHHLHMRVLRLGERLAALQGQIPEAALAQARTDLYRSECNCAYWHGVFGGLYLNNLRHALSSALLRAERALDVAEFGTGPFLSARAMDFDADLSPEVTVRSEALTAILSPALGGSLLELSDVAKAFMVTDVLARREEGYHQKLRELDARGGGGPSPSNPNAPVETKEANLSRFLVFDAARRTSFVDRFYDPAFRLDQLTAAEAGDLGALWANRYAFSLPAAETPTPRATALEVTLASSTQVRQGGVDHPLTIEKRFAFSRGRAGFDVRYRIGHRGAGDLKLIFAPELNFTLLAGDAPDRLLLLPAGRAERLTFRGEVANLSEVALHDGWSELRVDLTAARPFELWTYPVETVSQSEGGFERTYQGTCLLLRTPIALPAGGEVELHFGLELSHSPLVLPAPTTARLGALGDQLVHA